MKERWRALDWQTRVVIILAFGFVLFRTAVASLSGFGFHQGWNEGHYALIASGFLEHPLVPEYGGRFVYNVPPLFPYTVTASFVLFGESVLAARLPSILATGGLIVATYDLGREVFEDRSVALLGALILAALPYVQLFGGRAQTDALMVFFVTASLTAIVRGYQRETKYVRWLIAGAALFSAAVATKQPAFAVSGIVFFWLLGNKRIDREAVRRTAVLIGASALFLLPVAAWFYLNYLTAPTAFVADWEHELFSRTKPFANVRLLLAIAFGLGITPPVLGCAAIGLGSDLRETLGRYRSGVTENPGSTVLTWWLLLYGAFVLVRTPHGHQYYAVVLAPPIALFAARGVTTVVETLQGFREYGRETVHLVVVVLILLSTIAGTVVLFELSGEFSFNEGGGTQVASDAGDFVTTDIPKNSTVLVSNGYEPPLKWYLKEEFPIDNVETYRVASLTEQRLQSAVDANEGPVYLVYPQPAWSNHPTKSSKRVYETSTYEYTFMSVLGSTVDTNSKFTFYLNDRQLVVYEITSDDLQSVSN